MVESAEFSEVDRLPEIHTELMNFIKDDLGPKALETLRLIPLLCKRRQQRLAGLMQHLNRADITQQEVCRQIQNVFDMEQNFRDYDGGLLKLDMQDYVEMHNQGKLVQELMNLEQSLAFEQNLADARNHRDLKPLLKQVNDMAVTIGQLNSPVRDHALNLPPICFTGDYFKGCIYQLDFTLKQYQKKEIELL